jgi:hypothetical protein
MARDTIEEGASRTLSFFREVAGDLDFYVFGSIARKAGGVPTRLRKGVDLDILTTSESYTRIRDAMRANGSYEFSREDILVPNEGLFSQETPGPSYFAGILAKREGNIPVHLIDLGDYAKSHLGTLQQQPKAKFRRIGSARFWEGVGFLKQIDGVDYLLLPGKRRLNVSDDQVSGIVSA